MRSVEVSLIIFICIFGGALLGMLLHRLLPEHHLSSESKDVVKLGTGLIGTMSALVLGLMVASAKSSYDTQRNEVTDISAGISWLDRVLAHYGPESHDARRLLKETTSDLIAQIWKDAPPHPTQSAPVAHGEMLYDALHQLSPQNDEQRALKAEALSAFTSLGRTRSLLARQAGSSISVPFLTVVVFWLAVIFVSFGLFAPLNPTVMSTLLICALSVAGAMFLVLEMDQPFRGLIQVPRNLLETALQHLGR